MADAGVVRLVYLIVPAVTLVVQGLLAYWVYTTRLDRPGSWTFVFKTLTGMVWLAAVFGHVWVSDPVLLHATLVVWTVAAYTSISAFIVFGSKYADAGLHRHVAVRAVLLFSTVGIAVLAVTNRYHHLVWREFDRVQAPFTYLYVTLGPAGSGAILGLTVLALYTEYRLGRHLLSTKGSAGWQLVLLVLGGLSITIMEFAGYTGLFPADGLSHGPYGALSFYLLTALAVFRFGMLDVRPVARSAIVERLGDPVVVLDERERVVDANERAGLVWPAIGDRIGDPFAEVCPTLATHFDGPVAETAAVDPLTLPIDGRDRHFSVRVSTIEQNRRADDDWHAILLRDVSDLERSRWRLEKQNERLDQVASTISHDLRNPIQVADGHVELAESLLAKQSLDAADREQARTHLSKVAHSTDRMQEIVDDVLTLAREGQTVEETEPVSLSTVARDAWDTVETGDATLVVDGDRTVRASSGRLASVFENLFRNAIEHATVDSEGGTLTVEVGPTPSGFYVQDDGPGVPNDDTDRIFESGYTTETDGTGLGLGIVRTMTEAHGWTVELDESHDGARFVFDGVEGDGSDHPDRPTPLDFSIGE